MPGQGGGGGGGRGGREDGGGFKSVLSLWREKVFALLVQARLQEMQHRTDIHQARCKVSNIGEVNGRVKGIFTDDVVH